ncbi:MAG: transposase [Oscillospiraceae bacterium]|jgi:transposase
MKKARPTTYEERLRIVKECLDNNKNYSVTAGKYGCSYQQVYNWVRKFEEMGPAGLEYRRGKRLGTLPGRTEKEELLGEIARLKRQYRDLEIEIALRKKFRSWRWRTRITDRRL